jgi:hypothetical protein
MSGQSHPGAGVIERMESTITLEARIYESQGLDNAYGADEADDVKPSRLLGAIIVLAGFAVTVFGLWLLIR